MNVQMVSNNPCLTPLIDGDRVSVILVNNIIDNPSEQTVNNSTLDRMTITDSGNFGYYGSVNNITISNSGNNYQSATVTFSEPTGITPENGGETATGTCVINNGRITEIVMTNRGIGYIEPPIITINGTPLASTSLTNAQASCDLLVNQIINTDDIDQFDSIAIGKYIDITYDGDSTLTTMVTDKQTTDLVCCVYTENVFEPTTKVDDKQGIVLRTRFVDEISPTDGTVYGKYITKPITLSGTSNMVKVIFAGYVPTTCSLDVYYKSYLNSGGDQYDDVTWKKIERSNPGTNNESTMNSTTYTDYEYTAENIASFDVVAVKIVFRGGNSAEVPKIKDLRVIATS